MNNNNCEGNEEDKFKIPGNGIIPGKMPFWELGGSYESIGYTVGIKCRDLIHEEIKLLFNILITLSPEFSSRKELLQQTAKYLPYAAAYAPELIAEIQGIAQGSETDFEEVFFINCFSDIFADACHPAMVKNLWGCTSFAAGVEATKANTVLMGQTFDLNIIFEKFPLVIMIKPDSGPVALIYTLAGIIGCIGVNSAGIALLNNKLFTSDSRPGVPFSFLVRKVLGQETSRDALQLIIKAHRATGMNYLVGDSRGGIFDLETTALEYDVLNFPGCFLAHANHCLSPRIQAYQYMELDDSIVRLDRAKNFLEREYGEITIEALMNLTRDHVGYPRSICHHPDEKLSEAQRMKTISAVVIDPGRHKMWVTKGNPCESDFIPYGLMTENQKGEQKWIISNF